MFSTNSLKTDGWLTDPHNHGLGHGEWNESLDNSGLDSAIRVLVERHYKPRTRAGLEGNLTDTPKPTMLESRERIWDLPLVLLFSVAADWPTGNASFCVLHLFFSRCGQRYNV